MLTVSSLPGDSIPSVGLWQFDKIAHFSEYLVLAVLLFRYCLMRWNMHPPRIYLFCAGIIAVYAGVDEIHQMMIPFRSCSWQDFTADNIGAWTGLFISRTIYRIKGLRWA